MNLERHGSLKRKKKVKAVGYLTPTPCLTIFYKARPYLVVATYGLISKCANIAIRVSYHCRVITMFWVLDVVYNTLYSSYSTVVTRLPNQNNVWVKFYHF